MTPDEVVAERVRVRNLSPEQRLMEEMERERLDQWKTTCDEAAKAAREASTKK